MKTAVLFLSMILVLSAQQVYAQSNSEFTREEIEVLEHAKNKGASEDQLKQLKQMLKAKRDKEKQWSEKELNDLDGLLLSKWNGMRRALAQGDVDSAARCFSEKTRENYRKSFSILTKKQLSQLSEDLRDAKFIKVQGGHYAEYNIRIVKDGKTYSHILVFEKNSEDIWEIRSFLTSYIENRIPPSSRRQTRAADFDVKCKIMESIIKSTNQNWKLYICLLIIVIGGAVMLFGSLSFAENSTRANLLLPLGSLVGLIGIGLACFSIRCPKCQISWVWHAISKKHANKWVSWLITFSNCPKCDFPKDI